MVCKLVQISSVHLCWEILYGMEKALRLLGLPAAAQGMVCDTVKEINCLARAGENPWEQMAQSVFSLLLLPSECEEKLVLEGLRRLQADKQVLDSLRHLG